MASPFPCAVGFARTLVHVTQGAFIGVERIKVESGKEKVALYCRTSIFVPVRRVVYGESTPNLGAR